MPTGPLLAGVHENQTEWPPTLPACSGSPGSTVASEFDEGRDCGRPAPSAWALAKSSLVGAAAARDGPSRHAIATNRPAKNAAPVARPRPLELNVPPLRSRLRATL